MELESIAPRDGTLTQKTFVFQSAISAPLMTKQAKGAKDCYTDTFT